MYRVIPTLWRYCIYTLFFPILLTYMAWLSLEKGFSHQDSGGMYNSRERQMDTWRLRPAQNTTHKTFTQ